MSTKYAMHMLQQQKRVGGRLKRTNISLSALNKVQPDGT